MIHEGQTVQIFEGERYKNCGLDEDALSEIIIYQKMLKEVAKALWKQRHPDRTRLPADFEKKCSSQLTKLYPGSTCVDIKLYEIDDGCELEDSVELIAEACEAINNNSELPLNFPKNALPLLKNYGKTLKEGESITQKVRKGNLSVKYSRDSREKFIRMFGEDVKNTITVIAEATMVNVRSQKMDLLLDDGRRISANFKKDHEEIVLAALKEHNYHRLEITGIGLFSSNGDLEAFSDIESINSIFTSGEIVPASESIWETFQEILGTVPKRILDTLPTDSASEIDHYLYGATKKKNDI